MPVTGDPDEVVYYEGTPAVRGVLGAVLFRVILGIGVVALGLYLATYGKWIPVAGLLMALVLVGWPVVVVKSTRYRITSYRIDYERGVFSKRIDTLELWHIEDITFRQSLVDRMLGIGTITVMSHDETTPILPLRDLPGARSVFDALKQRIIAVKRQRGVIKLDAG